MVKKIHTRAKRKVNSGTHLKSIRGINRKRSARPKTFQTVEAAEAWAKRNAVGKHKVEQSLFSKKFKVIVE